MRRGTFLIVAVGLCLCLCLKPSAAVDDGKSPGPTGRQALDKLMAGNHRFVSGQPEHPNSGEERRSEVAKGQRPYAIVLTCADSRTSPEIVFDQGLGDLFVVRVAGNILDDHALGSIEYGVAHLGARLILVMGHSKCGAVDAAVQGGHAPGHIAKVVEAIVPAVKQVRGRPGSLLDNAINANVVRMVSALRKSQPILAPLVTKKSISVVGARYDLDKGQVVLLP